MDKFHTDITQIGNLINSLITDLEEKYLGRNVYVEMYETYGVIDMIYYSALKCEIRLTVCLFEKIHSTEVLQFAKLELMI